MITSAMLVISKGICECRACQLEPHFRGEERFRGLGAFQWCIVIHFAFCFCGGGLLYGVSPSSLSHHLVAAQNITGAVRHVISHRGASFQYTAWLGEVRHAAGATEGRPECDFHLRACVDSYTATSESARGGWRSFFLLFSPAISRLSHGHLTVISR